MKTQLTLTLNKETFEKFPQRVKITKNFLLKTIESIKEKIKKILTTRGESKKYLFF